MSMDSNIQDLATAIATKIKSVEQTKVGGTGSIIISPTVPSNATGANGDICLVYGG